MQVMTEVNTKFGGEDSKALISLPPVIWSQLRHQLQPLLTYRAGVDHSLVLQWCHHRLKEVAEARYLTQDRAKVVVTCSEYIPTGVYISYFTSSSIY